VAGVTVSTSCVSSVASAPLVTAVPHDAYDEVKFGSAGVRMSGASACSSAVASVDGSDDSAPHASSTSVRCAIVESSAL